MNNNPITANLLRTPAFVIANTFLGVSAYDENQFYPLTPLRMQLLCYAANKLHHTKHMVRLFYEDFIVIEMDNMLVPVLPSLSCLYNNKMGFVRNIGGDATVVDTRVRSTAVSTLTQVWEETRCLSNKEIIAKYIGIIKQNVGEVLPC